MFPSTAPYNGPSSSDKINSDRLGSVSDLANLTAALTSFDPILDPASDLVTVPILPTSLEVTLPAAVLPYGGRVGHAGLSTLLLSSYSDNYLTLRVADRSIIPAAFETSDLVYQSSGTYTGTYLLTSLATSFLSVNLNTNTTFWQLYNCIVVDNGGSSFGPAITDQNGNGYICAFQQNGGAMYKIQGGNLSLLAYLPPSAVISGKSHTFMMGTTYINGVLEFTLRLDSQNINLVTIIDPIPIINPQSAYPGFYTDSGFVFFAPNSGQWYNDDQSPVLSWCNTPVPIGAPCPTLTPRDILYFEVVCGNQPITITSLFDRTVILNRVAGAKARLDIIEAAYF